MNTATHPQREFENTITKIFKTNDHLIERGSSDPMIIDDLESEEHCLSGTIGVNKNGDIILVATKDSEVNYIECISLDMIKIIIKNYCKKVKGEVILATNLPIDIHSSKVKDLEKDHKLFIKNIGYSFCMKHNLPFAEVY